MKCMTLKAPGGLDKFVMVDAPEPPPPGPGQVTVRLHASSLNYHDYVVAIGQLKTADNRIPMSDGAGVVTAVGEGVTELKAGDNVTSLFFPNWHLDVATPEAVHDVPGDTVDGYGREYVTVPATAF